MKIFFAFCLLARLGLGNGYAQTRQLIPVPLIVENKEIDGLLDTAIKIKAPYYPYYAASTKITVDSCWRVDIHKGKFLLFQMAETNMDVMNYEINKTGTNVSNYGYFQYRGHKIFVWINDYFDDFFTKSAQVTTFRSIYKLNKDAPAPSLQNIYRNFLIYKYFDGHFSRYVDPNPPPPVVSVKSN
ncbi:hypothetical protein [uncultured Mucilaginibacter sp.]|uniref:hypothetical protein n=1 Tax=uncultured Mucilaginibacter sp. TaxID=797541 RepID=UPI0025F85FF7|nr:hypothetical protein [uncultured Mucilaginibacter sp.]